MYNVLNEEGAIIRQNLSETDAAWFRREIKRKSAWRTYQVVRVVFGPLYNADALTKLFDRRICYKCGCNRVGRLTTGYLPLSKAPVWWCIDCETIYHAERDKERQRAAMVKL